MRASASSRVALRMRCRRSRCCSGEAITSTVTSNRVFRADLEKQGDDHDDEGGGTGKLPEEGKLPVDLGKDRGMGDGFQPAARGGIGENTPCQRGAVQLAVREEHVRAEHLPNTLPGRLAHGHHLPGDLVRIDDRNAELSEVVSRKRFPAGDSPGEPDNHSWPSSSTRLDDRGFLFGRKDIAEHLADRHPATRSARSIIRVRYLRRRASRPPGGDSTSCAVRWGGY